jgi:two-component system response regulator YesN
MGGEPLYRAVMVDDEPFMLEGMRMMIDWARCGFSLCGEAGTAQEALRLVDTVKPHLVITDVRMPGMLGTDLAAVLNRYHPGVIIVLFSGYRDFAYVQAAIRSHAFAYLVKPIDVEEVEATLAACGRSWRRARSGPRKRLPSCATRCSGASRWATTARRASCAPGF